MALLSANFGDGTPFNNTASTADSEHKTVAIPSVNNPDASVIVKTAVDRMLYFLSNASNETLGACLVGLGATTYLVLGRVGLIIIGAVGGVVLHATWESSSQRQGQDGEDRISKQRSETNAQIALRLLEWREAQRLKQSYNESAFVDDESSRAHDFSEFEPETGKALNIFTEAVIRDYVGYWYDPVRPAENVFPSTCRRTFTSFILGLSSNLSRKRPADTFLEFVTNSSSIVIVLLNELSSALALSPSSNANDAIQTYLDLKPESSLGNILDEPQQRRKLDMVANDILEHYLDTKVFNCPPARVFLREILANVILDATIQRCCRSEWINEWIVYLLEDGEPELLNAIDAGVEESSVQQGIRLKMEQPTISSDPIKDPTLDSASPVSHKRSVSKAEEAMEDAMREAQRLTQLIAEEDAKHAKENFGHSPEDTSDSTNTHGIQTPASSQDDLHPEEGQRSTQVITSSETTSSVDDAQNTTEPAAEASIPTNLDHDVSSQTPQILSEETEIHPTEAEVHPKQAETLTLHKANFTIFDDAAPNDRRPLKTKPAIDYMIQIEPLSSNFGGWMIARTYTDFETLHEVLRRISAISGIATFTEAHSQLPPWKGTTKSQLTGELERYLTDAVDFEPLAESEGMKRFLEKSRGVSKSTTTKNPFWAGQAAIENVGKGMFDVLSKAPKGVAGGGKAMFDGVTSVLGGGQNTKKTVHYSADSASSTVPSMSTLNLERRSMSRDSLEQTNSSLPSLAISSEQDSARSSTSISEVVVQHDETEPTRSETDLQMNLPPRPSDIPDNYRSTLKEVAMPEQQPQPNDSIIEDTPISSATSPPNNAATEDATSTSTARKPRNAKPKPPISSQEAQVTIELLFAVINELYLLSSAWNIRRTLLNAAKAYLVRPGNPQLEHIRALLQDSALDANTSDAGMAAHILKLRENTLPTEEELKAWPDPLDNKEKEALRKKARKLLVERGMPQALTSVMGAAASGEALGRVFDCLQVELVARGFIFGVMLQAVKAVTQ